MNQDIPQSQNGSADSTIDARRMLPASEIEQVYTEHALLLRGVAIKKFAIPPGDAETLVHDVFAAYIANPGGTEIKPLVTVRYE